MESMLIDTIVNPTKFQRDTNISGWSAHSPQILRAGAASITRASDSHARFVISAVPPEYGKISDSEETITRDAYKDSLKLAKENFCTSIAFPILGTGTPKYPIRRACQEAIEAIYESEYIVDTIIIVARTKSEYETFRNTLNQYLENNQE